jgi:hypothetical protein
VNAQQIKEYIKADGGSLKLNIGLEISVSSDEIKDVIERLKS